VVPLSDEAARVVLGRDLSRAGMRADASARLVRGDEVLIALHVDHDGPPLVLRARVEADAETDGPWLRFKELSDAEAGRLDSLLAAFPVLAAGDGPEHPLVVCEILAPRPG
jgi:hypothetical protein